MPDQHNDAQQQPPHTNRLAGESSPYLLQHAHNPVDWYPWGEEAFELARTTQRPIFLSIGYSTCYWCHVMERESFEDVETAKLMNEHFVCIKVDREERPDVDDVYMAACQLMNQSGGWPLNAFLIPPPPADLPADQTAWTGLLPFYCGTYYPPIPSYGRPSFQLVLEGVNKAWNEQHDEIIVQAGKVADAVTQYLSTQPEALQPPRLDSVTTAMQSLLNMADTVYGGLGSAPKFPQPVNLRLLMDLRDSVKSESDQQRVDAVLTNTLNHMAMGGMFDQIGGGFHRYSTDERWMVPHFEKMLYDNGQLAEVYALAAESTGGDPFYAHVAGLICDYVLREMTDPAGGFYSAQDAEVDGREGLNYLWTPEEAKQLLTTAGLSDDDIQWALDSYGLSGSAFFKDPHHPDDPPRHILHLPQHPDALAEQAGLTVADVFQRLAAVNAPLYEARTQRKQPGLDDKVIAGWNGLMIAGLAETGRVLNRPELIDAAARAWDFIHTTMRREDGSLARTWRHGHISSAPAACADYAWLIHGLLTLHNAEAEPGKKEAYRTAAVALTEQAHALFWDDDNGGYFDAPATEATGLFVRGRSGYDGAIPSANGVMLNNLIDLHELTGEQAYLTSAIKTVRSLTPRLVPQPASMAASVRGLARLWSIAPDTMQQEVFLLAPHETADADPASDGVTIALESEQMSMVADGETRSSTGALLINIPDGHHINAHDPGQPDLIGMEVVLQQSQSTESPFTLTVEYPDASAFTLGDQAINVYGPGTTRVPFTVSRVDDSSSSDVEDKETIVHLQVRYQVCTDTACLAPATRLIPISIPSR
ncbi:MAG: thioredoxin domain-containing protein [Planctomycetes bacterium]|nr:thioredoxin domain-containing protein [Planctomycetota bacterium]